MRNFFANEDRKKLQMLKGDGVDAETTQKLALPEAKEDQELSIAPASPKRAAAEMTPVYKDWREYSNAQNPLTLQNFMDLDELDLNYNLMTTYDP